MLDPELRVTCLGLGCDRQQDLKNPQLARIPSVLQGERYAGHSRARRFSEFLRSLREYRGNVTISLEMLQRISRQQPHQVDIPSTFTLRTIQNVLVMSHSIAKTTKRGKGNHRADFGLSLEEMLYEGREPRSIFHASQTRARSRSRTSSQQLSSLATARHVALLLRFLRLARRVCIFLCRD